MVLLRMSLAFVALLAGCSFPERTVVPRPPVELRNITLHVLATVDELPLDSTDLAVATALGWGAGLPGVELTVTPLDDDASPLMSISDGAGHSTALSLAVGRYQVEGRRLLSDAEKSSIGGIDAEAIVGVATITVSPAGDSILQVRLPFSYRRGLMLSEWAFSPGYIVGQDAYYFGGFAELYNNGTETAYLDGMQIAKTYTLSGSTPDATWTCAAASPYQEDSTGAWTTYFAAFPGSGSQYAVPPGGTVVVAMDAIDHRGLFIEMIDLSGADFEFPGGPDNPAAPDMVDRSLKANPIHDHGPPWQDILSAVAVLVRPGDLATYARSNFPITDIPTARLPAVDIVDALASANTHQSLTPGYERCRWYLHPRFDRQRAFLLEGDNSNFKFSLTRRVLYVDGDGRAVLQHTRTSVADWMRASRTPGAILP